MILGIYSCDVNLPQWNALNEHKWFSDQYRCSVRYERETIPPSSAPTRAGEGELVGVGFCQPYRVSYHGYLGPFICWINTPSLDSWESGKTFLNKTFIISLLEEISFSVIILYMLPFSLNRLTSIQWYQRLYLRSIIPFPLISQIVLVERQCCNIQRHKGGSGNEVLDYWDQAVLKLNSVFCLFVFLSFQRCLTKNLPVLQNTSSGSTRCNRSLITHF